MDVASAAPTQIGWGWNGYSITAAGDVTGDGYPDLLGTPPNGSMLVYPGNGTGVGEGRQIAGRVAAVGGLPSDLSAFDWVLQIGDIKGRTGADFIVREAATASVWLYPGTAGVVAPRRLLGEGFGGYDLAG